VDTRTLGRTGLQVSEIGFGAWAIGGGWGPQDDGASLAALHRYAELGGNFIDTALAYGGGHSEQLIGRFLKEHGERDRFVIASKIPPQRGAEGLSTPMETCYPAAYLRECVDRSLGNVGLDRLDGIQLHTWAGNWNEETVWIEVMQELKRAGKIRFFGVSVVSYREVECVPLVRAGKMDTIQTRFNLLDQAPRSELLPAAMEAGVGVIARTPLGSGTLTGKMTRETVLPESDWRSHWLKGEKLEQLLDHLEQLSFLTEGRTWPEAALQFVLAHREVSVAIPGIRSPRQVEQNIGALVTRPLSEAELRHAHELYNLRFGRDEIVLWR
jgi:aryl-alcohol dehydrogenase-like predicted oxidoreductase